MVLFNKPLYAPWGFLFYRLVELNVQEQSLNLYTHPVVQRSQAKLVIGPLVLCIDISRSIV